MTAIGIGTEQAWAPQACTLPTAQRPLRVAEFDELFATALRRVQRIETTRLRLTLDGTQEVEATARELTAKEIRCCSFFGFTLTRADDAVLYLDVEVPEMHIEVLDALAERAEAALPDSSSGARA